MKRIIVFSLIAASLWTAEAIWLATGQPEISAALALRQLNGGADAARKLREFETFKNLTMDLTVILTLFTALLCFDLISRKKLEMVKRSLSRLGERAQLLPMLVFFMALTSGCVRPYDMPEYVEIDTSETGFLIPLEGDNANQAKFQSEDYLKQRMVATKRVQITHRWSQEGRVPGAGRWIPTVRLIKVNRSPITREWATTQTSTAGGASQRADKAIWIESGDSVGFSMGFTCTAFIPEEEASRFLY